MRNCKLLCLSALAALLLCCGSSVCDAQTFESVGVRAQGLAGAFVAVADDATASWWNPAGQAGGAYLSAVIEHGQTTEPANPSPAGPGLRSTAGDIAVSFPAFGLSYYRLRISEIAAPASTAGDSAGRQDQGIAGSSVRSAFINQLGITVGQSLGDHLVVGSTLKLLRGGVSDATSTGAAPLDDADALDVPQQTKTSFDVGAMVTAGHLRLGAVVKNVTEPSFSGGLTPLVLERQARVGLSWRSVTHGLQKGATVAADADLTTTSTAVGDVRHVAGGMEFWTGKGRFGARGGVSANTIGATRPAASGGLSLSLTRGLTANVSRTVGRDDSVTGWSTSVSVAF
jgi:hypothetical protein